MMGFFQRQRFDQWLVISRAAVCVAFLAIAKFYIQVKQWQDPPGDMKQPWVVEWCLRLETWVFAVPFGVALLALALGFSRKTNRVAAECLLVFGLLWFAWVILCWEIRAIPSTG